MNLRRKIDHHKLGRSPWGVRRRGFTLLELFLTLSLAVVLMTLVNAAFRFYARDMDSNDTDMRRTMLASALMQMIEDDLRATLHPEPLDTTELEQLLANTAASATGASAGGSSTAPATASASDNSTSSDDTSADDTALDSTITILQRPGLIGNQYQIQIDTSRLPRLEEYVTLIQTDPTKLTDLPSDLKTVTYYVQQSDVIGVNDTLAQLGTSDATDAPTGAGLVRRVLDRIAHNYAVSSGNITTLNQTGELLAPEVTGIEFSYWDGVTWQIEWNSDELGELPLAVKIDMVMMNPEIDADAQEPRLFQHIVRLPMANFIETEEDELSEAGI